MRAILAEHFAVFVVLFVFVLLFCAYIVEVHTGHPANTLDWLEGELKEVVGAILMGLTGKGMTVLNGQRKGDIQTPEPPKNGAQA